MFDHNAQIWAPHGDELLKHTSRTQPALEVWHAARPDQQMVVQHARAVVLEGDAAAHIEGIRQGTSNPIVVLPEDTRAYQQAIAEAISQSRLVGVNGPYRAVLSADAYTAVSETSDHGYPVLEHIRRLVSDEIVWAPASDFALHLGQDVSMGYSSRTDASVRLYLQETFTFLLLTIEAAVALRASAA